MPNDNNHNPKPLQKQQDESLNGEIQRLVVLWAFCCTTPLMYLAAAAITRGNFMAGTGYFPVSLAAWNKILICLAGWLIILQGLHFTIKYRSRAQLTQAASDSEIYLRRLTRRTYILITLSELAVFSGFCLFLIQGDLLPVFGGGIAAMLLYAQSHPRSANGISSNEKRH